MSTDSVYRAVPRLEEKGLLKVIQSGEGRAPSRYQVPRSDRSLRPQDVIFELCCRNLRPQDDDAVLLPQSAATSEDASGRNLRLQGGLLPQSAATTDAAVSTRACAPARVGGWVGSTNQPTNPPTTTDRAREDAAAPPIDERAVEFMANLNLKRTPRIAEQIEIAELFLARINAGFTVAEVRNSVAADWEGVRDRVRVLIARLKEMPDRPLRPRPPAPLPQLPPMDPAEIRDPRDHAAFQAARAAQRAGAGAGAGAPEKTPASNRAEVAFDPRVTPDGRGGYSVPPEAFREALAVLERVPPDIAEAANAQARADLGAQGITSYRLIALLAATLAQGIRPAAGQTEGP